MSEPQYIVNNTPLITGLPIHALSERIISLIRAEQVVIVVGETGSGKTTQLPQLCMAAGRGCMGRIVCTQPRRIAATSVARRVAFEMGSSLGDKVGYKIRFDESSSKNTGILFVTDGILLAEVRHDPLLQGYDTIIIDEAHERSLNIDFLLGYLKLILPKRPDLRVIISSATIDPTCFSQAFGNAPVVEVSGRLYPVEVIYRPLDTQGEDYAEDYIDAAVSVVEEIMDKAGDGDVLVFMPSERDILETCDTLAGRLSSSVEILPLFARLQRRDQDRIFAVSHRLRVVVATNIAETSITVPGIRYVVDTGLARHKRFAPRARTTRLPIEPISQAAAKQRMGRCGRVSSGVCFRLYSADDLAARPEYTQPEIRRSNLADAILRLGVLRLGPMEEFPFLDPPKPRAISEGYKSLIELGALNEEREVTPLGEAMAKLPLDPSASRMLLASVENNVFPDVAIIVAGLAVVDPRLYPLQEIEKARQLHSRFNDPASDFIAYLKIWRWFYDQQGSSSRSAMRRICQKNLLSYNRMREWIDVHSQILDIMRPRGRKDPAKLPAAAGELLGSEAGEAIHRSLLAGCIANIAMRGEEKDYKSAKAGTLRIFPGSALAKKGPAWIMFYEQVETSQLFGRIVAAIKPEWLEQVAPHLCRHQYSDPWYNAEAGSVQAHQKTTMFGLPVIRARAVQYRRVDPQRATECFIRDALLTGELRTHHGFLSSNQSLVLLLENSRAKLRCFEELYDEEKLATWYRDRIGQASSVQDLHTLIRERGGDAFLRCDIADIAAKPVAISDDLFPDSFHLGTIRLPLEYSFNPGEADDGVTLSLPAHLAPFIDESAMSWCVAGFRNEMVTAAIEGLPRETRRTLTPLSDSIRGLSVQLRKRESGFFSALATLLKELRQISVNPEIFNLEKLPPHCRIRYSLKNDAGDEIASGRNLSEIKQIAGKLITHRHPPWHEAMANVHQTGLVKWEWESLPDSIILADGPGTLRVQGYPALIGHPRSVELKVFADAAMAQTAHATGVSRLLQLVLHKDLAWIEKELRLPHDTRLKAAPLFNEQEVCASLFDSLTRHLFNCECGDIRTRDAFEKLSASTRESLVRQGAALARILEVSIERHGEIAALLNRWKPIGPIAQRDKHACSQALKRYMSRLISPTLDYVLLTNYPRYLRSLFLRVQKSMHGEPAKTGPRNRCIEELQPLVDRIEVRYESASKMQVSAIGDLVCSMEEFIIGLFAQQEVKVLYGVSEEMLRAKIKAIEEA